MADIGRRGFVKGATLGALASTVGGVEIIMAAEQPEPAMCHSGCSMPLASQWER